MGLSYEEVYEGLLVARSELERLEERYLAKAGWGVTSNTPDYVWRWTKTIDGTLYAMGRADAVEMQERIDRYSYSSTLSSNA